MAQEKKGKDKAQKKSDDAEEKTTSAAEEHEGDHASAKEAHDDHDDHAHAAKAHGGDHGDHEHKPNRKEYWVIFVALLVLTVLEVGIAQPSLGISKTLMRLGLVSMALAKAALVAMFYMHLKHETRVLRLTVFIPLATPALYAVVLISEAAWRLIR
ncbi:MAG: cytochrome C oxidase subunit IV family protein [Polyangiaceae bacterium]